MVQFMEFRIFEFSKLRIVAFFLKDFSLFDIERVAARFLWSWSIVALVSLYPCLVISTYGIQSFICVAHILSWLQIQSMWAFVLNNVHDEVIQNRFYCQWKFCWCCCYASAENGVLNIGSGSREGSPPLVRAHKVTTCHRWRVSRSKLRYKDRVQCGLASLIYFWNGLVSFGRGNLDRTRAPSVYHTWTSAE